MSYITKIGNKILIPMQNRDLDVHVSCTDPDSDAAYRSDMVLKFHTLQALSWSVGNGVGLVPNCYLAHR